MRQSYEKCNNVQVLCNIATWNHETNYMYLIHFDEKLKWEFKVKSIKSGSVAASIFCEYTGNAYMIKTT